MADHESTEQVVARHIAAVATEVATLRREVDDLTTAVRGNQTWGLTGLMARVASTETRVGQLADVQRGLVADQQREAETARRRTTVHNRVQAAVLSLLATSVGGIIVLLVGLLLNGNGAG